MAYLGNRPAESYASFETETFSVSATTNYTLSHAVTNENEIRLVINGVVQQPGSGKAYTASGTTLTLTSATVSGDSMYAVYLGRALQTVNPPNASVGLSQLSATGTKSSSTFLRGDNTFASAGGTNSPSFRAEVSSSQNVTDATATVINFDTETFDNGSCYDGTNKFTVPSGEAGKYFVYSQCNFNPSDLNRANNLSTYLYKNGSRWNMGKIDFRSNTGSGSSVICQDTMDLAVGDYIQIYAYIDNTTGTPIVTGSSNLKSVFSAYKIIE